MTKLTVFDTETTGIPDWKKPSESPHQPHIVQLAAHQVDIESREIRQTMNVIVRPDGWTIPEETVEIHGITTELALDVGVAESLAVEMFVEMVGDGLRVAHNTTFDNRLIRIALMRFFSEGMADTFKAGEYECTMQQSRKIMLMPKNKPPKLSEAFEYFCEKELDGAHNALVDVGACLAVYWAIKDQGLLS